MTRFDSLAAVLAAPVVGVFSADSDLVVRVHAFVADPSFSVADRAAALRFLASSVYGFDGVDAGVGVPDSTFLSDFLDSL